MPHNKKKKHSRHGKPKGAAQAAKAAQAAPAGVAASEGPAPDGGAEGVEVGPRSPTAAPEATSQQKQPTSAPVGLASTGKPAEFEKAATSPAAAAAKPAATTAAAGAAAAATAAVKQVTPGAATAPKESPKQAKAPASPSKAKPFNAAAGAAVQATSPKETPKESPKTTPIASSKWEPAKTEPAKLAVGADKAAKPADNQGKPQDVKPKESPKPKPSSLSKVEPSKPVAGAADVLKGKPKPGKPQEGSKKPVVDPFDALADSLPSEAPAPTAPVYTGPEVTEHGVTSEKGILCGEDERTLPPGYRFEDMGKNIPADLPEVKPTKPLSTDEALDSLSLGFESSPPPSTQKKEPKVEDVSAIDALSSGFSNFAPPPPSTQKEIQREKETNKGYLKRVRGAMVDSEEKVEEKVTASASSAGPLKSAAPPADKKAKLEKGCEDFSLKGAVESPKAPANKKPATDGSMSLDALSALGDLLPDAEPVPEPPKIRPEDMVKVDELKSEEAVRVGEREDTLPPDYRFKEEDRKHLPPPKIEPSLDAGEALDILAGGFDAPAVAPTVQAPLPPSTKAPKQPSKGTVDHVAPPSGKVSTCHAAPPGVKMPPVEPVKKPKVDDVDFVPRPTKASAVQAPVPPPTQSQNKPKVDDVDFVPRPTKASAVQAPVPPPTQSQNKKAPPTVAAGPAPAAPTAANTDESMSLDALSALGDLLPDAEPVPEPPKIRPEDMVKVDKLTSEEAVRVGEREDTLPPDYRFKEEDRKHLPPPKIEPSLDAGEALDILAGGFDAPAVAPTVQAPLPPSTKAPKQPSKGTVDHVAPPSGKVSTCYASPPGVKMPPVKPVKKPVSQPDSDFSLDALVDDVVTPTAASAVQGAPQLSDASDAMDALSDTLKDIAPAPAPAPVPVKDVVKEKKVVEEKVIKMGERDDTLPPEFQLTEKERKEMEKEKAKAKADVRPKKKSIDDDAALDLLSGDFSTPAAPAAVAASAAPKTQSAACPAETMPGEKGPVLDALSSTLLPDTPGFRPKQSPVGEKPKQSPVGDKPKQSPVGDKPKAKSGKSKSRSKKQAVADTSAIDELSGQLGSDVVSTSPAKKSSKS
ncbi:calpastatin isoform X12 [Anguilla anguilla]|uniref:calpastatin isoform X12 n=1 Tax=Anguilla anguilla TaxID=7936 RepID=UPI0015B04ACD|nr:calpastatin isoform X12 [Anguilla anguilla]